VEQRQEEVGQRQAAGIVEDLVTGGLSAPSLSHQHKWGRGEEIIQPKRFSPTISALQTVLAVRMLVRWQAAVLGVASQVKD
jgi:hypothetical protein